MQNARLPLGILVAAATVLALVGPFAGGPALVLATYVVAGLAWIAALASARAGAIPLWTMLVGAVLLRVLALASDLRTSDDPARVVWEGRVILAGASPYAFAPDAPELAELARSTPRLHAAVNHREIPAAYPPLVQAAGVASAFVAGEGDAPERGVRVLRALFAAIDLALLVPLVALLRRRGLPDGLAVAWGWCPLAVFEIAGAGHLEALALAPLLGALALGERARTRAGDIGASALFAAAILAKVLPIVLLPWFVRSARPGLRLACVLAFVALGFAAFLPPFSTLRGAEDGVWQGITHFALRWDAFNFVHRFVEGAWFFWFQPDLVWWHPPRLARGCLALAWIAWAWRTWRRERDPARAALDLFGAWIVVTPVLHPWYALWCVPWLAWRRAPAFVFLATAIPLAFAPVVGWQSEGVWREPAWLWPVIALPFAFLLWRSLLASARARAHARDPSRTSS